MYIMFRQGHRLPGSRHYACRRYSQNLSPISSSVMAAVSSQPLALQQSGLKQFKPSSLKLSLKSKVHRFFNLHSSHLILMNEMCQVLSHTLYCLLVVHEPNEEESVEFSWKRHRLFNHTACLVLYQMCMEVCASVSFLKNDF